jgi:hypothetical protein
MTAEDFRLADQEFDPAIPVGQLHEHPENYNEGDVGAISESLDEHGFYGAVIVQRSTGAVLVGNHRFRTATMKGAATIPGFLLDCDDDEARRILAVDNRTTQLSTFNNAALLAVLGKVMKEPRGLKGTGYDGDDVDDLIKLLGAPNLGDLGGDPDPANTWPTVSVRVPHHVAAAWNAKVKEEDPAAVFAGLLGVELEQ